MFDFDEAYQRIAAAVEDGSDRVRASIHKSQHGTHIDIQIDKGRSCVGCFKIALNRTGDRVFIGKQMSYRIDFSDVDVRRALIAAWAELDRQQPNP